MFCVYFFALTNSSIFTFKTLSQWAVFLQSVKCKVLRAFICGGVNSCWGGGLERGGDDGKRGGGRLPRTPPPVLLLAPVVVAVVSSLAAAAAAASAFPIVNTLVVPLAHTLWLSLIKIPLIPTISATAAILVPATIIVTLSIGLAAIRMTPTVPFRGFAVVTGVTPVADRTSVSSAVAGAITTALPFTIAATTTVTAAATGTGTITLSRPTLRPRPVSHAPSVSEEVFGATIRSPLCGPPIIACL